jgi:hypothetical protein
MQRVKEGEQRVELTKDVRGDLKMLMVWRERRGGRRNDRETNRKVTETSGGGEGNGGFETIL